MTIKKWKLFRARLENLTDFLAVAYPPKKFAQKMIHPSKWVCYKSPFPYVRNELDLNESFSTDNIPEKRERINPENEKDDSK